MLPGSISMLGDMGWSIGIPKGALTPICILSPELPIDLPQNALLKYLQQQTL